MFVSSFLLTIRNLNVNSLSLLQKSIDSFLLTIRNLNFMEGRVAGETKDGFLLTIRNLNKTRLNNYSKENIVFY